MLLANTHVLQRGRVGRAAAHRAAWESCFLRGVEVPLADTHVLQRGGCLGKAGVLKGCLREQLPWSDGAVAGPVPWCYPVSVSLFLFRVVLLRTGLSMEHLTVTDYCCLL